MYVCVYIYIERERERDKPKEHACNSHSNIPPLPLPQKQHMFRCPGIPPPPPQKKKQKTLNPLYESRESVIDNPRLKLLSWNEDAYTTEAAAFDLS